MADLRPSHTECSNTVGNISTKNRLLGPTKPFRCRGLLELIALDWFHEGKHGELKSMLDATPSDKALDSMSSVGVVTRASFLLRQDKSLVHFENSQLPAVALMWWVTIGQLAKAEHRRWSLTAPVEKDIESRTKTSQNTKTNTSNT